MYLISKKCPQFEYRIYIDNNDKIDGQIIYKGHKLGVESNVLNEILEYKIEKSSNTIFFLKYDKIIDTVDHKNKDIWESGTSESMSKLLLNSWTTLSKSMVNKFGEFRKIIITKVNI